MKVQPPWKCYSTNREDGEISVFLPPSSSQSVSQWRDREPYCMRKTVCSCTPKTQRRSWVCGDWVWDQSKMRETDILTLLWKESQSWQADIFTFHLPFTCFSFAWLRSCSFGKLLSFSVHSALFLVFPHFIQNSINLIFMNVYYCSFVNINYNLFDHFFLIDIKCNFEATF